MTIDDYTATLAALRAQMEEIERGAAVLCDGTRTMTREWAAARGLHPDIDAQIDALAGALAEVPAYASNLASAARRAEGAAKELRRLGERLQAK